MNAKDAKEERLTLELLDAIDQRNDVSQRHLARQMGVALGLANSYLKRCVRKGLVKISDAPANRYLYYLTPKGFTEKSRLTARFLATSFSFYRQAAQSCTSVFEQCKSQGIKRLLICGVSDLAEIALLRAMESDLEVVAIFDADTSVTHFFSKPVINKISDCDRFDAAIVTDLKAPLETYKALREILGETKVFIPDVLRVGNGNGNSES